MLKLHGKQKVLSKKYLWYLYAHIIKMNVLFEIIYKIARNLQCPDIIYHLQF